MRGAFDAPVVRIAQPSLLRQKFNSAHAEPLPIPAPALELRTICKSVPGSDFFSKMIERGRAGQKDVKNEGSTGNVTENKGEKEIEDDRSGWVDENTPVAVEKCVRTGSRFQALWGVVGRRRWPCAERRSALHEARNACHRSKISRPGMGEFGALCLTLRSLT